MTRTHRKTLAAARAKAAAPKPKRAPKPPNTGHIFDDPDALTALRPDAVIIMNSIYTEEIRHELATRGLQPELLPL